MTNGKLKWRYDRKNQEWYTMESVAYANDDYSIRKEMNITPAMRPYSLRNEARGSTIGRFYTLTAAKTVANLLQYGK